MATFDLLVDGERIARVRSEQEVRDWLARYREEHAEDDPDATHVQIVAAKLIGGRLVPRDRFL